MEIILVSIAGALFIIQLLYLFIVYGAINRRKNNVVKDKIKFSDELPPLSVIVCAHDQAEYLQQNLPALLKQDYPEFEVIVINDNSTDDTKEVLTLLSQEYPHLYHSFTSQSARYISHKKLSLTLGIKAAKNEWLVFTEPDCKPTSDQWLRLMARNFTPEKEIVLGYSSFESNPKKRQRFIAFDTLITSMQYLGMALIGNPFMGVGKNMAYRKSLFIKNKGFASNLHLLRGEDSIFINRYATSKNTAVETDADAMMTVNTWNNRKTWKEEKMNYLVSAKYFKGMQRFSLGFETFTKYLFYGFCIAGLVTSIIFRNIPFIPIYPCLILLRYLFIGFVWNKTAANLGESQRYYLTIPLFDLYQPIRTWALKIRLSFTRKKDFIRK